MGLDSLFWGGGARMLDTENVKLTMKEGGKANIICILLDLFLM